MKKRTYILLVICVMLLKMAGSASGITVVDAGGSGDYTTIQGAIDNVGVDGDYVIQVNPGTYYEDIDFDGEPIHLYSSGGPEVTTIDGTGEYHVVTCDSSEVSTTILEGFTITGGNADGEGVNANGGGMYIYSSSPTVIDCTTPAAGCITRTAIQP